MFLPANRTSNLQRGMTLVEVVISLALMMLLSLITVAGMVMHARMAKSNLTREQLGENSRRFLDGVQIAALDSTIMQIDSGPAGAGTVLTFGRPDPFNAGGIIYKQFAYLDGDGHAATIGDNRVVQRNVNTPAATTGKEVLSYCSLITGSRIFEADGKTVRQMININIRTGDRTYPANSADNAITGTGYQSFLVSASVSQL